MNGDYSTAGPPRKRGSLVGLHSEDHGGGIRRVAALWAVENAQSARCSAIHPDRGGRLYGTGNRGSGGGSHRGPKREREQGTGVIARLAYPHITRIEKTIIVVSIFLVVIALIFGRIS